MIKMIFQIKKIKDYIRSEQSKIYKIIDNHKKITKFLEEELKFLEECREEINKANKLLREK